MKKTFSLILLVSSICFGQTKYDKHDELISEANSYKAESNFETGIEKYKEALEILIPSSSTPFFDLASCALQLENEILADEWIRKGVSQGGAQMSYLRKYKGFENIQKKSFYIDILSDYNSLRQDYFSTLENIDIYLEIEELTARDQFVRKIDDYISGRTEEDIEKAMQGLQDAGKNNDTAAIKKYQALLFPKPIEEYKKLQSELMQKIDSLNVDRLMEITKEYGWQERAWIILWHQRGTHDEDNYVWNYFRPMINKEIEEGKISRTFWSAFEQFKQMMKTGNFGTIKVGEKPKEKN
jgi:hypothetical protein